MTTFSTTDRGTFKTCRELWDHVSLSRRGLGGAMPNTALLLGSLVHYTIADWIDVLTIDPKRRFVEHLMTAEKNIRERYEAKFNSRMDDSEWVERYDTPVGKLGLAMIANYEQFYGSPLPKGFTVIATEQTVTLDVPGTEHCVNPKHAHLPWPHDDRRRVNKCILECHKIEGTFDAIAADARGTALIFDHKTYARRPSQSECAQNDQFLTYTWMGNQLGLGPVAGVYYNGLMKREAPVKGKTIDDLFFRTMIPHPREEIEDFGRRLTVELNEMGNNPTIYLNRSWYSCPNCAISDLCMAKTRGEDYQDLLDEMIPREKSPAWRAA